MNNFRSILILFAAFIVVATQTACSVGGGESRTLAASVRFPTTLVGDNVLPLSVGACGAHGYENEPCISVTICRPGTTQCQTVDNILVDTGSYGLKIFKSVITIPLDQVGVSGYAGQGLASCTGYLDGSGHWGQVVKADVQLANKKTTTAGGISMVTLDGAYSQYTKCGDEDLDKDPKIAGFNGIIGVGSFVEDCSVGYGFGSNGCTVSSTSGKYWRCKVASPGSPAECLPTAVPAVDQLVNPVARMPANFNNGIVIKLPSVPLSGAGAAYGYMILGIGSPGDANNSGTGLTVFEQDHNATFDTQYNGTNYSYSFIDSGSNFNGFPQVSGSPPRCSGSSGFYCPVSLVNITAMMTDGSTNRNITFEVGNMVTLASADPYSMVYRNIAFDSLSLFEDPSSVPTSQIPFNWGLPFFLGRSVYVGIYNRTANINGTTVTGPFWAF